MRVQDKIFVVTGAGSGLGRQLTLELTGRGAKVAALDFREAPLLETKHLAGIHVETFLVDVTNSLDVAALPTKVMEKFGKIDGIINNAGIIQPFVKVNDLKLEDAMHVMSVNFIGPLMMIKAFLPHLLKISEAHIVNVSSMGAYTPVPGQSVYGASKAALKSLTEGLTSELKGTRIGVTLVLAGAMNTNIATNSGINLNVDTSASRIRMTDSAVAAKKIVDAIESGRERLYIGPDARMMDLLTRVSPKLSATLIYRQMRQLLSRSIDN